MCFADNDEPTITEMLQQMTKSPLSTAISSIYQNQPQNRHQIFKPGSSQLVFEGAETKYAKINFQVYQGQREVSRYSKTSTYFEPKLQSPTGDTTALHKGEDEEIIGIFMQQFDLINQSFDENIHGQMLCFGRFGKIYYPQYPPGSTMAISELSRFKNVPKGSFNSVFAPQSLSHDKVRDFLETEDYHLDDSYTEYMVGVEEGITLHLDGNFDVKKATSFNQGTAGLGATPKEGSPAARSSSANNIKWLVLNVKRQDLSRLDIRLMFQSVYHIYNKSEHEDKLTEEKMEEDPVMRRYLSSRVIKSVYEDNVNIAESFKSDVTFIRRKIIKTYKKKTMENGEMRAFEATVFLMNVKQSACHLGSFADVSNWTSEVVIQPEIPNTKDKEESLKFVKEFVRFCFSLEKAAL